MYEYLNFVNLVEESLKSGTGEDEKEEVDKK